MRLRYVNHIDIERYESAGWKVRSELHWPHSQHAVLMIKEDAGENANEKEKVNENK
jgi:hypothetical protein